MDSRLRNHSSRHSRFVRNALGHFSRRQIHGEQKPLKGECPPTNGTTEFDRCMTTFAASAFVITPNNSTPWHRNSSIVGALKTGAVSLTIDAIGLIPEAGGVARIVGHQAGYVGKVADQFGSKAIKAVGQSTSAVNGAANVSGISFDGVVSTSLTVAGFILGANDVAAIISTGWDGYRVIKAIAQCPETPAAVRAMAAAN